jgi:hypothetical protein
VSEQSAAAFDGIMGRLSVALTGTVDIEKVIDALKNAGRIPFSELPARKRDFNLDDVWTLTITPRKLLISSRTGLSVKEVIGSFRACGELAKDTGLVGYLPERK